MTKNSKYGGQLLPVADPDLERRRGLVLFYLPCWPFLPSVIPFFTQNRGGVGGRDPSPRYRSATDLLIAKCKVYIIMLLLKYTPLSRILWRNEK